MDVVIVAVPVVFNDKNPPPSEAELLLANEQLLMAGAELDGAELDGDVLTCPWHGAQFNVRTGKVLRGPARQDILTYPVKIEGKSILVRLPEE